MSYQDANRVWLMGISKIVRVREDAGGGFRIQRLSKRENIKPGQQFDPDPAHENMVWVSYALGTQYYECIQPMIDLQQQLMRATSGSM